MTLMHDVEDKAEFIINNYTNKIQFKTGTNILLNYKVNLRSIMYYVSICASFLVALQIGASRSP